MKKLIILCIALTMSFPAFSKIVIGQINFQKVMAEVNQGKKADKKLKTQFKKWEKELKADEKRLAKEKETFDKQKVLKDQKWVMQKQEELQRKLIALQQKTQGFQMKIQKMEMDEKKPILERIKKVVSTVSKQAKVDLTVETSASPILYAKEVVDLTGKVIAAYNKKHK